MTEAFETSLINYTCIFGKQWKFGNVSIHSKENRYNSQFIHNESHSYSIAQEQRNDHVTYTSLVVIVFILVVVDVEVSQRVGVLLSRYNSEPISQVALLQELFSEVLQISLAELNVGSHCDDFLVTCNQNFVSQVCSFAVHLHTNRKLIVWNLPCNILINNFSRKTSLV